MGLPKKLNDSRGTEFLLDSEKRAPNALDRKPRGSCSRVRRGRSPYFESTGTAEEHHPPVRLTSREKWTPPRSPFNLIQVQSEARSGGGENAAPDTRH